MATVGNVLTFHRLDRSIYEKLIAFGSNTGVARSIIALWMWLELIGIDVIPFIVDCKNSSVVQRFMAEAEAILGCLRQGSPPPDDSNNPNPIPLTASLTTESVTLRFFHCQRDVAMRGITSMIDGVGKLIFDDYLYALLRTYERAVTEAEEARQVPLPAMPPELARSYSSEPVLSPKDFRSMILTFSKGHPIGQEDIIEYFTKWVIRTLLLPLKMYWLLIFLIVY